MRISDWSSDVCSSDLIDRAKEIGRDRRVVESGIAVEFAVTVVRVIGPAAADTALDPEGDLLRLALRVEAEEEGVAGHAAKSEGGLAGIRELLLDSGRQKGVGRPDIEQKDRRRRVGEAGMIHFREDIGGLARQDARRVGTTAIGPLRTRGSAY